MLAYQYIRKYNVLLDIIINTLCYGTICWIDKKKEYLPNEIELKVIYESWITNPFLPGKGICSGESQEVKKICFVFGFTNAKDWSVKKLQPSRYDLASSIELFVQQCMQICHLEQYVPNIVIVNDILLCFNMMS